MKAALMNQNTLPFVDPPSGPLASAPVASAANKDMWYNSTDSGLCLSRSVASDYVGAYGVLNTTLCLANVNWSVSFVVKSTASLGTGVYVESRTDSNALILLIGSGTVNAKKLNVILRDSSFTERVNVTSSADVFDGNWHKVLVTRNGGTITITVDDVAQSFTGLYALAITGSPTICAIGARVTTVLVADFTGLVCNFKKCNDLLMPLNETSGTDVKDSAGTAVGTVTAPGDPWWAYSWVPLRVLQ